MTKLLLAIAAQLIAYQAPPAPQPSDETTDKEALEFSQRLEKGILDGRPEAFDGALNMTAVVDAATRGLDLKPAERVNFRTGIGEGLAMGRKLIPATGNSYRLLGIRKVGPHQGPLFRLWSEDGLNYHLLKLKKSAGSGIRIADIYIFVTADWMSSILRRAALAIVADDPARRALLAPEDAQLATAIRDLRFIQQLANREEPRKALEAFQKLPEATRKDRLVQSLRIMVASKLGEEEYLKAEAEFRKLFPEDSSVYLMTLDGFVYRKDFAGALKGIDSLDRSLGGDPLLDLHRGNMYASLEKYAEAKKAGQRAAKEVPYLQEPRWLLVTVALKEKAHADTVRLLDELARDFKLEFENMESIQEYADFVKSAEYRDWLKSRASK